MTAWLEHLFAWFVLGNTAFIFGFSVVVMIYYARRAQHHLVHIALMATSFVMVTALAAAASNFRIFWEEPSRTIANACLFVAMLLADIGLLKMWRVRSGRPEGPMHRTEV